MVVCVAGESVYQDVRVLRLDELAAAVVEAARCARSVTELEAAVALTVGDGSGDGFGELVDGLVAVRVLEHARG